eukprot:745997-Hanusia_phi.AAC.2
MEENDERHFHGLMRYRPATSRSHLLQVSGISSDCTNLLNLEHLVRRLCSRQADETSCRLSFLQRLLLMMLLSHLLSSTSPLLVSSPTSSPSRLLVAPGNSTAVNISTENGYPRYFCNETNEEPWLVLFAMVVGGGDDEARDQKRRRTAEEIQNLQMQEEVEYRLDEIEIAVEVTLEMSTFLAYLIMKVQIKS